MSENNTKNNTDSKIETNKTGTKADMAFEDPKITTPYEQNWVCISFVSPETIKNCNFRAIKIRGVYKTKEKAEERAKFLQDIDPQFNIFVGEVGKWLGWDPDPNSVEDQHYKEKKLQELMSRYNKNRKKAQLMEEQRKREMLEESIRNEANKPKTTKDRLRDKLEKRKMEKQIKEIDENRTTLIDSDLNDKTEQLKKNKLRLDNDKQELTSIDDKLNKLQSMYKDMLNNKQKK